MTAIFVIVGTAGEYSDRGTWLAPRAFYDREEAQAYVRELDAEGERILSSGTYVYGGPDKDGAIEVDDMETGRVTKIPTGLHVLDPRWSTTYGTKPPHYSVEELEIKDAAALLERFGVQR